MAEKDISVVCVGKSTIKRCITVCIWTDIKLYNATDKFAYFVMWVININVRFQILAISILKLKVCFMATSFFLPKVLFLSGYVSSNELSESTYWKSIKNFKSLRSSFSSEIYGRFPKKT